MFENQSIESLLTSEYWISVCPWLSISKDTNAERMTPPVAKAKQETLLLLPDDTEEGKPAASIIDVSLLSQFLNQDGFVVLSPLMLEPLLGTVGDSALINGLARGVVRLLEYGHSASAISVYDEHWTLIDKITPLLQTLTGGNKVTGDIFSFARGSTKASHNTDGFGSKPHRDKPGSGAESFRKCDGSAMYTTVWVALTDANPISSCLYIVPRELDAGYYLKGDALNEALCSSSKVDVGGMNLENIQAVPVGAGGACVFSHRLLHWGSRPSGVGRSGSVPRLAMSFAMANNEDEREHSKESRDVSSGSKKFEIGEFYSQSKYGPYPPLPLRIALRAGMSACLSTSSTQTMRLSHYPSLFVFS
jgi:hypothetical protein